MWLSQNCECVAQFLGDQLVTKQPRDDNAELLCVALVALGKRDLIPGGVYFSPPGAYHHARWMAKELYCLKMLCYREQFLMNAHKLQAIKRIGLFTTTIYLKVWYTASVAYDAPNNDLSLLQQLETFHGVDSHIAQAALHKLKGHLWYLSEDLVALSLFSNNVFSDEKRMTVAALSNPEGKTNLRQVDPKCVKCFRERSLSQFVTKKSLNLFTACQLTQMLGRQGRTSRQPNKLLLQ